MSRQQRERHLRQLPSWPPLTPLQPVNQQQQTGSATDLTSSATASSASQQPPPASLTVAKTCDRCRRRKIKCSGDKPTCATCAKFGTICAYSHIAPRCRRTKRTVMSAATPTSVSSATRPGRLCSIAPLQTSSHGSLATDGSMTLQTDSEGKQFTNEDHEELDVELVRLRKRVSALEERLKAADEKTKMLMRWSYWTFGDTDIALDFERLSLSTEVHLNEPANSSEASVTGPPQQPSASVSSAMTSGRQESLALVPNHAPEDIVPTEDDSVYLSREVINSLVDVFNENYNTISASVLHWQSFRRQARRGRAPRLLLLAVMGVAALYSNDPRFNENNEFYRGREYIARAKQMLSHALNENIRPENIYAIHLLSVYEQHRGKFETALAYSSLATQLAIRIGLNRMDDPDAVEAAKAANEPWHVTEMKRRLWWQVALDDNGCSMTLEVPSIIHSSDWKVNVPCPSSVYLSYNPERHEQGRVPPANLSVESKSTHDTIEKYIYIAMSFVVEISEIIWKISVEKSGLTPEYLDICSRYVAMMESIPEKFRLMSREDARKLCLTYPTLLNNILTLNAWIYSGYDTLNALPMPTTIKDNAERELIATMIRHHQLILRKIVDLITIAADCLPALGKIDFIVALGAEKGRDETNLPALVDNINQHQFNINAEGILCHTICNIEGRLKIHLCVESKTIAERLSPKKKRTGKYKLYCQWEETMLANGCTLNLVYDLHSDSLSTPPPTSHPPRHIGLVLIRTI